MPAQRTLRMDGCQAALDNRAPLEPCFRDMQLGDRLRDARQSRGLSLRALGELTGFSASFHSQVELGQASPSLGSLQRIADALEVTVASLVAPEDAASVVLRKAGRGTLRSEWSRATVESLVPGPADEKMQAVLIRLDARGRTGATTYAPGRRLFAYCISGTAILTLAGPDEQFTVEAGDSVIVDGPRTTAWESCGGSVTEILAVTARIA